MKTIINDIPIEVEIIRKSNKNIYLRVKDDLKLYITCPYLFSKKEIEDIIEKNTYQIYEMYQRQVKTSQKEEFFNYLGKSYVVVIDATRDEVGFDEEFVYTPSKEMLDKFYKDKCLEFFEEEIAKCRQCFSSLPNFTLKLRKMKTRWGVCNKKSMSITLNTELIHKDVSLIDYVIIHELCHFKYMDHSKQFWSEVEKYYPYYKLARERLKQ